MTNGELGGSASRIDDQLERTRLNPGERQIRMNELSNDANYNELKAELRALRAQVEDLNAKLKTVEPAVPTARRRMIFWLPDSRWLLAAGLLVLVGAVAQTSSDPAIKVDSNGVAINRPILANNSDIYFLNANHHPAAARLGDAVGQAQIANIVDYKALMIFGRRNAETPQGRIVRMFDWVGIGGKGDDEGPRAELDVRGKVMAESLDATGPITGTALDVKAGTITGGTIQAGKSEIYFTKTDHDHVGTGNKAGNAAIENAQNFQALMILGRRGDDAKRVVRVWDKLGIGGGDKATVKAELDVKGEIRGKLWRSDEFSWTAGEAPTKMTRSDRSVCFLTRISGWFNGDHEFVEITDVGGNWMLRGEKVNKGTSKARCIGAPDDSW